VQGRRTAAASCRWYAIPGYKMMVLLSAARLVRMVRKRRRKMPSTEVLLLSKGWRGAEQLVVGKVWMNTEAEGIEEVTY
jgi:hypothetical protein